MLILHRHVDVCVCLGVNVCLWPVTVMLAGLLCFMSLGLFPWMDAVLRSRCRKEAVPLTSICLSGLNCLCRDDQDVIVYTANCSHSSVARRLFH